MMAKEFGGGRLKGFVTEGEITALDPGKGFFGTGFVFRKADGDMNGLFLFISRVQYLRSFGIIRRTVNQLQPAY